MPSSSVPDSMPSKPTLDIFFPPKRSRFLNHVVHNCRAVFHYENVTLVDVMEKGKTPSFFRDGKQLEVLPSPSQIVLATPGIMQRYLQGVNKRFSFLLSYPQERGGPNMHGAMVRLQSEQEDIPSAAALARAMFDLDYIETAKNEHGIGYEVLDEQHWRVYVNWLTALSQLRL